MIPISVGDLFGPKRRKEKNRQSAVVIFDLDEGGKVFDGKLQTDSSKRCCVWHKKLNRFISPEEVSYLGSTRGIKLTTLTEWGVEETVAKVRDHIKSLDGECGVA
jgi:hypothetical protein